MTNVQKGTLTVEFHQFERTLHEYDIDLLLGKTYSTIYSELTQSNMTKEMGSWH